MIRTIVVGLIMLVLAACGTSPASQDPLVDLGAFRLGHNVVVASKAQKGPVSRDATADEWVSTLQTAVQQRFGRYDGDQLYHFGISVEGYILAPPGVPVLYKPRSALIVNVTVWDDAANSKLNNKVQQFTVFESTTSGSFWLGSGYERTKEQQMAGLSENAMREIEEWMLEQRASNGWFDPRPGAATEVRIPPPGSAVPQE